MEWIDYEQCLAPLLTLNIPQTLFQSAPPKPYEWSTDTRTLKSGDFFIPLSGPNFDGHDYLLEALEKGAKGFLYSQDIPLQLQDRGIRVQNCLKAYQAIAHKWRTKLKNLKLIAITGSNGKTTTKEMISLVLRTFGETFATEENYNNEIGVPKTLLKLTPNHHFAVLEFGARRPGNIKELVEIADPDISILLNAGMAHVGVFGSVENLRNTKLEIFRFLKKSGTIISPIDDPNIDSVAQGLGLKRMTFGSSNNADFRIDAVKLDRENLSLNFSLKRSGKTYGMAIRSPHQINAFNAAATIAVADACGLNIEKAISTLKTFHGVTGRFHIHQIEDKIIIDDSYNANPNSMEAGLKSLNQLAPHKKVTLILGDMLELGDKAPMEHKLLGQRASQIKPAVVYYIGEFSNHFKSGLFEDPHHSAQYYSFERVDSLLDFWSSKRHQSKIGSNSLVYIKASRGIKLDKALNFLISDGTNKNVSEH